MGVRVPARLGNVWTPDLELLLGTRSIGADVQTLALLSLHFHVLEHSCLELPLG